MVSLYRDPAGERIFDGMDSAGYRVSSSEPAPSTVTVVTDDGRSEHLPETSKGL